MSVRLPTPPPLCDDYTVQSDVTVYGEMHFHVQMQPMSSKRYKLNKPKPARAQSHRLPFLLPICQPQDLSTLTTFGVTAAVSGTRIKMKLL